MFPEFPSEEFEIYPGGNMKQSSEQRRPMNNMVFFINLSGNHVHNEFEYRDTRSKESVQEATGGSQVDDDLW